MVLMMMIQNITQKVNYTYMINPVFNTGILKDDAARKIREGWADGRG